MSFYPDPFLGSSSSSSSTAASSTLTTPIDLESTFSLGPSGLDYFDFASLGTNDGVSFSPSPFDSGSIFSLPNSCLFDHIPSSLLASRDNVNFDFDQPPASKVANASTSFFPSSSNLSFSSGPSHSNATPLPLRGRKRTLSQHSEDGSQSTARSPSPPRKASGRGKARKVKKEDDEDESGGSDPGGRFDGDEYAGGMAKGGMNKSKAERRKATNRASAKAFRARRKRLLSHLQVKINERDEEIESLQSLIVKLRDQKETLLSKRKQSSSSGSSS